MIENLQLIMVGLALLVSGIYALTGFRREPAEDGETQIRYMAGRWKRNIAVAGLLAGLAATVAIVPAGYAGVIYDINEGVLPEARPEGVHLVIPFKQHVVNIDTRVQVYTYDIEDKYVLTLDTQEVRVPVAINYHISDPAFVHEFVFGDIATTIVEPAILREIRSVVGQYQLEKVAENQSQINIEIEEALRSHFEAHGIAPDLVSVLDVIPQRGIVQAIENEKIEERNLITAEHRRNIATLDAEALIELATGEAGAIERIAVARENEQNRLGMTGAEYLTFVRWDGVYPTTLVGDAVDILLGINE